MSLSIDDIQSIYESPCFCGCGMTVQECLLERNRKSLEKETPFLKYFKVFDYENHPQY